ncbi:MAG TPA: PA14 domain-containing protein, partial [Chthoniobacteraceae bacterium]|nr:PA14 domain-containing protein [Chthoniobacteraceae bacterium]
MPRKLLQRAFAYLVCAFFCTASESVSAGEVIAGGSHLRVVTQYSVTSANDHAERDPRDWRLVGSTDDGKTWQILDQRTNQMFLERFETKTFTTVTRVPCTVFRFEVVHVREPKDANSVQIADLDLKGEYNGLVMVDLRPKRTDLITVQGEYTPMETRRMVFDGNFSTKWLDFNTSENGERSTWIQWRYDTPPDANPDPVHAITRVIELNIRARTWAREPFLLNLKGTVLWRSEVDNSLVINDGFGAALVRLTRVPANIEAGSEVTLKGLAQLARKGGVVELIETPIVDNDGIKTKETASGSVYLRAGRHPITVEWFNRLGEEELKVEYEGPGIPRQVIPANVLFRGDIDPGGGDGSTANGLSFAYYEGEWDALPNFALLSPVNTGFVSQIAATPQHRADNCGMAFTGFIEVPRDGDYHFHLTSDDGSRLYIGRRHLELVRTGTGVLPVPGRVAAGSVLSRTNRFQWVSGEGEVAFVGEGRNGWELVLQSRLGSMTVLLARTTEEPPYFLVGSRVRVQGVCVPTSAEDEH